MTEAVFWVSALLILYAYAGYPLMLRVVTSVLDPPDDEPAPGDPPSVTMIVPVYNERQHIVEKMKNTAALDYPAGRLEVLFVSDGSTDGTADLVAQHRDSRSVLVELETRRGKAAALNAGLERAQHEIVVFSDASIFLEPDALCQIVRPFASARIGCVSGEDRIAGSGGEALYGQYELFIRRRETRVHSIVGASGCFYAARRALCEPFVPNLAPDFLSVLRTVERGFRAVAEPRAGGTMAAVDRAADEFQRKVRTLLRGITTLIEYRHLLNPFRYRRFSWLLFSHKLLRWLVPFLLVAMFASNLMLARDSPAYALSWLLQAAFYGLALSSLAGVRPLARSIPARVALYFTTTNAAAMIAWLKYFSGVRQELWSPSRRAYSGKPPTDA